MTGMTDRWTDRLSEYVDGDLDAATRAELEAHLVTCASCRTARDEIERVAARARRVGYREPARDLWSGIESSIGATPIRREALAGRRRLVTVSVGWLAAAASVVGVISGGIAWTIATNRAESARSVAVVDSTRGSVPSAIATPALGSSTLAVASYREAAADLQRAFDAGRASLRPETTRVIEDNLRTIDLAIAQADSALRRDPGSAYLNQYLADTMQRKLKLLRRAVEITAARS